LRFISLSGMIAATFVAWILWFLAAYSSVGNDLAGQI